MPVFAYAGHETGGKGGGISRYLWDEDQGRLTALGAVAGIDDAIWLVADAGTRRLYACCAAAGGGESIVHAFAIDPATGDLTALNSQPAGGTDCCHASLSRDGRFLMVANYNGAPAPGTPDAALRIFPITTGGLGGAVATMSHHGNGPHTGRQERDHAHWVMQAPRGNTVLVADLGIDRLVAYALNADGTATPRTAKDLVTAGGLGPRHGVFSADGKRLFVITELIATVLSFTADPTGAFICADSLTIPVPPGGHVQPSGIQMTADGRFLFGALRGTDEVIGIGVDPETAALHQTGCWPSGGKTPRDLILSPGGRHLIVAHQEGHCLSLHHVDVATGLLQGPMTHVPMQAPMLVVFVTF